MKKLAMVLTVAAITAAGMQSATAGEREWATTGKILTGVVAGSIIASAATQHAHPAYGYSTVTHYYPAPVVTVPAPVVVHRAPVVVHSAPVIVHRAPRVVVHPAPVISFNFSHGHYKHRAYGHHPGRGHGRGHQVCR